MHLFFSFADLGSVCFLSLLVNIYPGPTQGTRKYATVPAKSKYAFCLHAPEDLCLFSFFSWFGWKHLDKTHFKRKNTKMHVLSLSSCSLVFRRGSCLKNSKLLLTFTEVHPSKSFCSSFKDKKWYFPNNLEHPNQKIETKQRQ